MTMKTGIYNRNKLIIGLIVAGIVLLGVVQGIIMPQMEQNRQQYLAEQQDPLTHDFGAVLQFKHPYMGNASNLANLFNRLPLNGIEKTFQLFPEILTAEVNYKETVWGIGEVKVDRAMIYNATAAFALIDNLEELNINFTGSSYKVLRSDTQQWYGVELATLAEEDVWAGTLQDKLADEEYVRSCKKALIKERD